MLFCRIYLLGFVLCSVYIHLVFAYGSKFQYVLSRTRLHVGVRWYGNSQANPNGCLRRINNFVYEPLND